MTFPILVYGTPSLKKPSEPVGENFPELAQLVDDMFETMYASDGVGLAAPQIGRNIRLVVLDASAAAEGDQKLKDCKRVLINPEIYETSDDEVLMNEGCLSVPGIHEDVYRPEWVRVRYLDEQMTPHDELLEGFAARIAQHEIDHLEGTLFVERLSALRKTLLQGKLSSMSKGKYKADYKTRQNR
ncbi:peptide deformylase [Bacteroidia bacterium]|nr:peptide deformylase [Bacteroidia bacterium]